MSLVTIIVPVYKTERYLKKCVDSILNQTYKDIELFLVDDGSPDGCGAICDEYAKKDERVNVIHKENGGQALARNAALDMMSGEYVMFVDSDDHIKENMVEVMLDHVSRTGADIVLSYASFDNGFNITESYHAYESPVVFESAQDLLTEYFTPKKIQSAPWGKLFLASLFDDIRFPAYRAREDYAIMHRLFGKARRACHCAESLYVQYVRPGSTEYSPFNLHKLKVIDCDLDIKNYVKERFPNLYPGVKTTYASAIHNCMADISSSFVKRKNKKVFLDLRTQLKNEIDLLRQEDPDMVINKEFLLAVDHPGMFDIKHKIKGLKRYIRRMAKKVLKRR